MGETAMKNYIEFIERNIRGAWVIRGILGRRWYEGYTKKEAIAKYNAEVEEKIVFNERKVRNDSQD